MNGNALITLLEREGIVGGDVWGSRLAISRAACDPDTLLSSTELDRMLDVSLLRWPYFSLLRDGAVPDVAKCTKSRNVIGHQRTGFMDGPAIRSYMRSGASLKLNRMSDWHRPSRGIREALESVLPVAVSCYAFWTPPEKRGMLPHSDGSHVIAIQLEGCKEWRVYGSAEQAKSQAGLTRERLDPAHEFVLEPGDVLYLPHGMTHDAYAIGDENSLHLTFTLAEPTPEALLNGLGAVFAEQEDDLHLRFHQLEPLERTVRTQRELDAFARSLTDDELISNALGVMRKKAG